MFDSLIKAIQDSRVANIYENFYTDGNLKFLPQRTFEPIKIKSLDGFNAYVKDLSLADAAAVAAVVIESHTCVKLVGYASPITGERQVYVCAEAEVPEFRFGSYSDREYFQIAIASKFLQTPARDKLIQLLGKIAESNVKQTDDDGISQTVTVKTGIQLQGEVIVPSTIKLSPYRTFAEITQPESEFLLRMRSIDSLSCALFEADGGAWKLEACNNIKAHLQSSLPDVPILM
jgi:hypothetical protein